MTLYSMERRQDPRRTTKKHKSFVLLPEDTKLGEIIDISMGGMAFHYISNERWSLELIHCGTLFGEDDLWLDNIPLKTISDNRISHPFSLGYPEMRRRGVQFHNLTPMQKEFIEEFISVNTLASAD